MIAFLVAATLAGTTQTPSIRQYLQDDFRDASMVAKVVRANQAELRKINDDFGQSYRFDTTTIHLKEPFKLRIDASVEDTTILYIVNGATQVIRIPRAKINTRQDLSMKPGRRQTALDFGILTPSLFESLFEAKFVRMDRATGDAVFDMTYPARLDDTSRYRIWIDPSKHYITKREWYGQTGKQKATFYYEKPVERNGVWLPSLLTVRNVEDHVAGVTRYESLKANTGISDSQFEVR